MFNVNLSNTLEVNFDVKIMKAIDEENKWS